MIRSLRAAALCASLLLSPGAGAAQPLPALDLDPAATAVSGLSSGAFMAVQLQVAFSRRIAGAGIVAGGPYGCAEGNVYRALRVCMNAYLGRPDAAASLEEMRALAAAGRIDDTAHLAPDRVYLFHGRADDTVARASMDALRESYAALGLAADRVRYVGDVPAGHGFVTERGDLSCGVTAPDFLVDCDIDQAGDILGHLHGPLAPAAEPRTDGLLRFDQATYAADVPGMDDTGFVYVPASCASGAPCRLHVALHGCRQGREELGEAYARLTGYNRWAEANGIVVLYPQARSIPAPWWNVFGGNPNGCWDWWGYAGDDHLTREAPQIAAIARMATALGAPLTE
jgi:poly(3-hydroxybutyrate) depolymerase